MRYNIWATLIIAAAILLHLNNERACLPASG